MKELVLSIGGTPIPLPSGARNYALSNIISTAVSLFIFLAIILSLFYIISGGVDIITANGEKEKVNKARQKLTFAAIGLVVVFLSFLIVSIIGQFFDIKLLTPSV